MAIAPATNPAQFRSFSGVGVEKTQAARGGRGAAGLASLTDSLAMILGTLGVVRAWKFYSTAFACELPVGS